MPKVSTNITIDAETKAKAQAMLADLGLDLSTAVNIFLKQMLYEGGIPFSITREIPNRITLEAMKEAQEMSRSPESYKKYDTIGCRHLPIGKILCESAFFAHCS